MFSGVNYLNLDTKNRFTIPVRHRDILQTISSNNLLKVIVTLDSRQCLFVYPEQEWVKVKTKVENLPNLNPVVKSYQRLILGCAELIEIDKTGRLLIPAPLRQMIGLVNEIAVVGMGNKLEIWNKENWDAEINKALDIPFENLSNLLDGLSV